MEKLKEQWNKNIYVGLQGQSLFMNNRQIRFVGSIQVFNTNILRI